MTESKLPQERLSESDIELIEETYDETYTMIHKLIAEVKHLQSIEAERDRYKVALEWISEYWNRDENERAMSDALWKHIEIAENALEGVNDHEKP